MSTARTIRRFTGEPVDDPTLARCLRARDLGTFRCERPGVAFRRAPVAGDARRGRARAAAQALEVIEPVYGMSRPAPDDDSRRAADEPRHVPSCTIAPVSSRRCCSPSANFPHLVGAAARGLDLPGGAELPVGCSRRPGTGGVPHQLGVVRRGTAAPGGRRGARRLDARRPRGRWDGRGGTTDRCGDVRCPTSCSSTSGRCPPPDRRAGSPVTEVERQLCEYVAAAWLSNS